MAGRRLRPPERSEHVPCHSPSTVSRHGFWDGRNVRASLLMAPPMIFAVVALASYHASTVRPGSLGPTWCCSQVESAASAPVNGDGRELASRVEFRAVGQNVAVLIETLALRSARLGFLSVGAFNELSARGVTVHISQVSDPFSGDLYSQDIAAEPTHQEQGVVAELLPAIDALTTRLGVRASRASLDRLTLIVHLPDGTRTEIMRASRVAIRPSRRGLRTILRGGVTWQSLRGETVVCDEAVLSLDEGGMCHTGGGVLTLADGRRMPAPTAFRVRDLWGPNGLEPTLSPSPP